jgi:cytochrome c oxidase subunit 2
VKFEITGTDVLHSFWVPAFRMKIDAVPGKVTTLYVTPTVVGAFDDDPNMRVQCAEICGTGHARMRTQVVVVEPDEFEEWLAESAQARITE